MQTATAMYCEFTLGFGMHETLPMQTLPTFCVNHADLAFPECPSGLTMHLKACLIPLQRSSHQQMQTYSHWEKERYQAQKREKCIKHRNRSCKNQQLLELLKLSRQNDIQEVSKFISYKTPLLQPSVSPTLFLYVHQQQVFWISPLSDPTISGFTLHPNTPTSVLNSM